MGKMRGKSASGAGAAGRGERGGKSEAAGRRAQMDKPLRSKGSATGGRGASRPAAGKAETAAPAKRGSAAVQPAPAKASKPRRTGKSQAGRAAGGTAKRQSSTLPVTVALTGSGSLAATPSMSPTVMRMEAQAAALRAATAPAQGPSGLGQTPAVGYRTPRGEVSVAGGVGLRVESTTRSTPAPEPASDAAAQTPGARQSTPIALPAAESTAGRAAADDRGSASMKQATPNESTGGAPAVPSTPTPGASVPAVSVPVSPPPVQLPADPLPSPLSRAGAESTDAAPTPATPVDAPTANEEPGPLGEPPLLFEVAWEVCWQLGGIYTVLRTKAAAMQAVWGDRYFLIGPYNPHTAAVEFEEMASEGVIREALDKLRAEGIPCHYGRWLIPGRPRVILLDYRARYGQLHTDKYLLWKDHGISAPSDDGEINEVVAFGATVTQFFAELASVAGGRPLLAHFHEWMGGYAVPRIAHLRLPVTTVFTTHATLLGRYLANNNPYFYQHLDHTDADGEAAKFQIYPRFALERAAAHAATVFTTVSEVTAREAHRLLGRQPDAILPNGLNVQKFAALHEFQNLHREYKERIHSFVMGHFFPSYSFDLDNTLYFFTSGRYEYRNKGMDLFIEALYRLNQRMRSLEHRPTVVAFVITRAANRHINVTALQNQSMLEDLRSTCREIERQMGQKLFMASASGRVPGAAELISEDALVRLKRAIFAMRTHRQPLIVTHDLADDAHDGILCHLRHRHMFNAADDPVKVVFHPEFVTATSPLLGLDYEQFVRGCHVGVFPSYYEPWGYTPMECAVMGVPAVTSDLSGFGAYAQKYVPDHEEQGLKVLNRSTQSFEQSADELAEYLYRFVRLNRRQRIELRNRVERLSEKFDWSLLAQSYHEAHTMALQRTEGRAPGRLQIRMV